MVSEVSLRLSGDSARSIEKDKTHAIILENLSSPDGQYRASAAYSGAKGTET